jgi:hypothetical protein
MRKHRLFGIGLMLAPLLLLPAAGLAAADAPVDRGHYEGANPPQSIGCPDPIEKSSTYWGSYSVREDEDGQVLLTHDTFKFVDTYRNTDTGEAFTVAGHVNLRETDATPVGPVGTTVYEYRVANAAQVVVKDSAGDVILRGAGRVTLRIVIDLATHTVVDGPYYLTTRGQHPLIGLDWCRLSHELIG